MSTGAWAPIRLSARYPQPCTAAASGFILDGVLNHVGRDFWAFYDVRQHGPSSPYCGWFQGLRFGGRSPFDDPFTYEGWNGHYKPGQS